MAAPPRPDQAATLAQFEAYFARADLDKDGKISGAEAVVFFQGSGLPKSVLAKVWMYSDQKQVNFLGREEFYNALRLITVAQTGRELTPEIVQAALKTPTIPAPKINMPPNTPSEMNFAVAPRPAQMGVMAVAASQGPGFRGQQTLPNVGMSQQPLPSGNNLMGQATPAPASFPSQGVGQGPHAGGGMVGPRLSNSNVPIIATDWFSGKNTGALVQGTPQIPIRGTAPSMKQLAPGSVPGASSKSETTTLPTSLVPQTRDAAFSSMPKESNALVLAGNGFSSDSAFGDVFSATPQAKQAVPLPTTSPSSLPAPSTGSQTLSKLGQVEPSPSTSLLPSGQLQQMQSLVKQNQVDVIRSTSGLYVSSIPVGSVGHASSHSQLPWPKFTQADVEKYTGIFIKVDRDKDGKITGLEARNLFLSWGLPRDVLKQVWDLSDQDNDSMLSVREFCIALYLMQRYREAQPLPAVLPESIRSDQTLLRATSQPLTGYGAPAWQPIPAQGVPGSRPPLPTTSAKPPLQSPSFSETDEPVQPVEQKSRVPVLEKHLVDQLSNEEQSALNSKFQEASDAEKKVQELEKEILDSKQKIEFYRTKMQELILYKSRCDNRLNEITERTSADKHEVESLAKKYEEKYKQTGDVASKLTIEEATFRDIQERKLELYNAIVKIEQGGTADGMLQARADKIQNDLEEIVKALSERCKEYGLRAKPTALIELPFGWQPGVQEGAADWEEDWDKFEDDGFTVIKELTVQVENLIAMKPKPPAVQNEKGTLDKESQVASEALKDQSEKSSSNEVSQVASSSIENKTEKPSVSLERFGENGSALANSEEDTTKSPTSSPGRNALENHSEEAQSAIHSVSSHVNENNSDYGGAESSVSGDKYAGEHSWGPTFDRSDDTDSVWSYNPQESEQPKRRLNFSFGSEDFGLFPPIKTDSPSAASVLGKEKGPFFDSVPSTPLYNSVFSPKFSERPEEHSFDNFGQPDFFGLHDSSSFPQRETFTRFDSFRSTTDYGRNETLASFDSFRVASDFSRDETLKSFDSIRSTSDYGRGETLQSFDSFRGTTDYGRGDTFQSFDSFHGTNDYGRGESFTRFDSIRSTTDYSKSAFSFDDGDFFDSKPFKSTESHSPINGTNNWNAF